MELPSMEESGKVRQKQEAWSNLDAWHSPSRTQHCQQGRDVDWTSRTESSYFRWKNSACNATFTLYTYLIIRVPTLLLTKKSRTFPGLSRTPMRNFSGPFRSPRMLKYKEKPFPLLLTPILPPLPLAVVHAFISSHLDYCNSLLTGVNDGLLQQLQSVQNAAARLVTGTRQCEHITPALRQLHWLPVRQCIQYKLASLGALSGLAPDYLARTFQVMEF